LALILQTNNLNEQMKKYQFLSIVFLLCLLTNLANAKMKISSPDFKDGEMIKETNVFNGFGCQGGNISPEVNIVDVPKDAKSLALTIYDPDAPTGSGWWHWIVYNIPTNVALIPANDKRKLFASSIGKSFSVGRNDFGVKSYGGPCPPAGHGIHHYILTVYALSVNKIDLPGSASAALIGYNINANTIEQASINAVYKR
jgi:hypothetical protein